VTSSTNPFADDDAPSDDLLGLGDDFGGEPVSQANNPFLETDDDDTAAASFIVTNEDPWASSHGERFN